MCIRDSPYVEKKYAGWNGVLRAWVCSGWECSGSFVRWLNACASDFEKAHDGVYIEFTPVQKESMRDLQGSGVRPPELLLFSPDTLEHADGLLPVDAPAELREELKDCGGACAIPVAMGGYIWVYNRALCDGAPDPSDAPPMLPDDSARSFSSAVIALMSAEPGAPTNPEPVDPGIDLGLPASADAGAANPHADPEALDRFIAGELAAIPVTQKELSRLLRLRDAGRGPDWACAASGQFAFSDQLLMLAVTAQPDADGDARTSLALEFARSLLGADAQKKLADIGAFSVTGASLYSDFSAYAPLDALLNCRPLIVPRLFSEYSSRQSADIVRELYAGRLSPSQALARLKSLCGLQCAQD